MEIFDVVDEEGNPTGETVERGEAHAKGILHRTVHIWVLRRNPQTGALQVLLQKRAQGKDSYPGCYDTSSAGHIQTGDEPFLSAKRELLEELGIETGPGELEPAGSFRVHYEEQFYGVPFVDNEVVFWFICRKPVETEDLILQKEEVESVSWFDFAYAYEQVSKQNPDFCMSTIGMDALKAYLEQNGNIERVFGTQAFPAINRE